MKSLSLRRIAVFALLAVAVLACLPGLDVLQSTPIASLPIPGDLTGWTLAAFGTTLAANKARAFEGGNRNELLVIASDIIYEGAAVGVVKASGHARPLVAGDQFAGFAEAQADNSAGAAAAIKVRVIKSGEIRLAVTGAVITDINQPVYASDDDTFSFSPVGGTFIGFVKRFESAGVVVVDFDAGCYMDPHGEFAVREVKSANYTLDAEDSGKLICVDTDAFTLTLPAIATGLSGVRIMNIGAYGAVAVTISPAAADMILGPDITGADDKDLINTKATAQRGDYVDLDFGDADGYVVSAIRGTWARQA